MINSTAIIVAGGKSSRMGTNKLLLKINGKPIIQKVTDLCKSVFRRTILITNTPENYKFLNIEMFADIYRNLGPLAGIHSGLLNTETERNFIVSADMPFINKEIIEFLFRLNSLKQIVLPSSENKTQPLCGIYKKNCIKYAEELLNKAETNENQKGKTKIKLFDLINIVDTEIVNIQRETFYHKELFFNMNTSEDYNYAKENYDKIMIK
jgi:molybdopterin-guanine dinucleotide biosynthesis protein A